MTVRRFLAADHLLLLIGSVALPMAVFAQTMVSFDLPAQPLAESLKAVGVQTNTNVLVAPRLVDGKQAPPLKADLTVDQAITRLLRGTGLTFKFLGERTVVLAAGEEGKGAAALMTPGTVPIRIAQTQSDIATAEAAEQPQDGSQLEEIVVTGTHIRGTAPSSSSLTVLDRDYIDRSGYSTLHQVIETLPQNFAGGAAENNFNQPTGDGGNLSYSSAVNLRGLGSGSTLTLLNGQRIAPAGLGGFVDISLIPLSAVERVEVLTDGASAMYGSDAVAGVVNIVLKKEYDGMETAVDFGRSTAGEPGQFRVSQTLGNAWNSGNFLASYEHYDRQNLDSKDRPYSSLLEGPYDLYPHQKTDALLLTGKHELNETVALRGSVLGGKRSSSENTSTGDLESSNSDTRNISVNAGVDFSLPGQWELGVTALYSRTKTEFTTFLPGEPPISIASTAALGSLEAIADGSLFDIPGGAVKLAVGASLRDNDYKFRDSSGATLKSPTERVTAAYAETVVPVFSEHNAKPMIRGLDVTAAVRHEHYSGFGTTNNPKFGLAWRPVAGLSLRGNYSKSFHAPTADNRDPSNYFVFLFGFPDPTSGTGTTLSLLQQGNRTDLLPETARTRTFGFDLRPVALEGLSVSATYFDIDYTNRIALLLQNFTDLIGVFNNEPIYAPLITREPGAELVSQIITEAGDSFLNLTGQPFVPSDVLAIIDRRIANVSVEKVHGVDASASYEWKTGASNWSLGFDGTYMPKFADAITPTAQEQNFAGSVFHVPKLKARASFSWSGGGWTVSPTLNYTHEFSNDTISPAGEVASWTTMDLHIGRSFDAEAGMLSRLRVALNVQNLFDRDPPLFDSPLPFVALGFDSANSNSLGRFVSLAIQKGW